MGYPSKILQIIRKDKRSDQWYAFFPKALAEALGLKKGESVEWEIESKKMIKMIRVSLKD